MSIASGSRVATSGETVLAQEVLHIFLPLDLFPPSPLCLPLHPLQVSPIGGGIRIHGPPTAAATAGGPTGTTDDLEMLSEVLHIRIVRLESYRTELLGRLGLNRCHFSSWLSFLLLNMPGLYDEAAIICAFMCVRERRTEWTREKRREGAGEGEEDI